MSISKQFAVHTPNSASSGSIVSGSFDSTGFTHIVVESKHEGAATTNTPTDNKGSTGWSSLTKESHSNGVLHTQLHWATIGTPGAGHTATITFGAARDWRAISVWLVNATSGVIQVADQLTGQGNGTAVNIGSLDPTAASVSFMCVGEFASGLHTPGTGWTEDFDPNGANGAGFGQSRADASGGSITAAATNASSQDWTANAVTFEEVVAAGGRYVNRQIFCGVG